MWIIICILTSFTWFCTLLDIKTHSLVFRQVLSFALFFFQLEVVSVAWHCKPSLAGLGVQRSTYSCFIFHSSLRYSLSAWQWLDIAWHCLIKYLAWDLISQVQEPFSGLLLQAKISSVKCFQAIHEFFPDVEAVAEDELLESENRSWLQQHSRWNLLCLSLPWSSERQ